MTITYYDFAVISEVLALNCSSPDEGSCSTRNNFCKFLVSDGIVL